MPFGQSVHCCNEFKKLCSLYSELEKAGIEVDRGGNVESPDPPGVLCVCVCVMCVCTNTNTKVIWKTAFLREICIV